MSSINDLLDVARGGAPLPPPAHPDECNGCDKFEVDDIYPRHKYWCWPGDGSVFNVTEKKECVLKVRKRDAESKKNRGKKDEECFPEGYTPDADEDQWLSIGGCSQGE